MLIDMIAAEGTVSMNGGCLKRAGFNKNDLIDGVQMGHPDKVMPAIVDDALKVISW